MTDDTDQVLSEEQKLIIAHKKERKELQAKIQVLKKTICKGDKKKKRDITEEILKLESDLDRKQDEEIACLKLSKMSTEKSEVEIDNLLARENSDYVHMKNSREECKSSGRVSKAQKRREKKEIAEKERNQRIIEQEVINIHGKRNVEIEAIRNILVKRNLMIHEIPSDGHCLYNAIAHQLNGIENSTLNCNDLREKTATHLRANADNFLPFITNPDSDELLSIEQYEKYCDDVAQTNAWGGAIELQVLSHVLKCPIEVIQASGVTYIVGNEHAPTRKLILTYHRHMYQLGAHYNSVTKYVKQPEDS
ncbi:PREDICTED: OTU domain-containing protein 6B [Ceratosolen solmsi marchali]|uniref:ubiquitinyl hydrolase 1 n=1 Tax=Ceratosolen solmsi marchali TaxID=326594 RepID=A0AAJ7DY01_9HYME|nr:PREDICTED: OTU domain-containing protein 6B [Ceratosolen solmsi marchali]